MTSAHRNVSAHILFDHMQAGARTADLVARRNGALACTRADRA